MNPFLKEAIIYQIYPISFFDSNGDGEGDLAGIAQKLDYVKSLGVNTVWINPFFVSPFRDGGYDVADYRAVDPRFGSMADFDALAKKCKSLGLKLILDFVVGHTSDQHPWFRASAEKERNEFWDRYIWTNNIFTKYRDLSIHGIYDRNGGYVINYYATQPALNFGFNRLDAENGTDPYAGDADWKMHYTDPRIDPLYREVDEILRFWLDRGVDGFRIDLASSIVKGADRCGEDEESIAGLKYAWDRILTPLRKDYDNLIFIAEWVYPKNSVGRCGFDLDYLAHDTEEWNELFRNEPGTNLLPAFEKGKSYFAPEGEGRVSRFLEMCRELYAACDGKGYFCVTTGTHDEIRISTKRDAAMLKCIYAFLLTFKHVPVLYYGDEIGMTHNFSLNRDGGYIRTGARTPMQWTKGKNCGFSTADEIYLPVDNQPGLNVQEQEGDENSLLETVRTLIHLRNAHSCLNADGEIEFLLREEYPLLYERRDASERIFVAINPSNAPRKVEFPAGETLFERNADAGTLYAQGIKLIKIL